jgi:tetratricopeptide (TPR) repeat protein
VRKEAADEGDLAKSYDELRGPSWLGLRLAQDLREEGRTEECRELGGRMLTAIEDRELEQRFSFGLQLAAEVQMTIGSSWTADDEPTRATTELEEAVERLESLEDFYVERGVPQLVEVARSTRANALVSLAVNANVKLQDSDKAREYFEQAYELRQDDFMRVLLACYRARSGLDEEAREILAEVPHAPRFYYNLACTYALLGDRERALDLLERELEENHPSPGSLEQQKDWARRDPDLASLRDDPRFRYLVGDEER